MDPLFQPIIIIGAARSGTKLVRGLIAIHTNVDEIPYDINYVWRLGNDGISHDELSPEILTTRIRKQIYKCFTSYSTGSPFLVEKTVSNCLRVPFVKSVFPKAKFIHLIRDGIDVTESMYRQWLNPPNLKYILRKSLHFPIMKAFSYACSYASNIFQGIIEENSDNKGIWGPRYKGIDADLSNKELIEVSAILWSQSVNKALMDFNQIPEENVHTIRYEDFVKQPLLNLNLLANFLGLDPSIFENISLDHVIVDNIGKGKRNLTQHQLALIQPYIEKTTQRINLR